MKDYQTEQLRNIVLLGHGSSGKTSLAEAMLYTSGAINRMGEVEDGTTVADYDDEERRRHISLNLAVVPVEWNGYKVNVLDTPGYTDFVGEAKSAVRVADAAVIVVDAVSGVEVGTELVWRFADEQDLARMVVINKVNRENVDIDRTMEALEEAFGKNFVLTHLPIVTAQQCAGVVDVVNMQALMGSEGSTADIPADMMDQAEQARIQLIEAAAEADDELIMKYLEGEELTEEEIRRGLRTAILQGTVVPVMVTAATENIGASGVLQTVTDYAPSPLDREPITAEGPNGDEEVAPDEDGPLAALVFKTTADPYVGKLTYFRVFRGVMASDSRVLNSRADSEERLGQLYVMRGKEQISVSQLPPGDIGAVAKLSDTLTGDTLCDQEHVVTLPGPEFPSPVFSVAVSPKSKADQAKLGPTMSRICEEDPTLRWRQEPSTKQMLLEGMGGAHVDIAVRRMSNRFDVQVETSTPKVPYRETITRTYADRYRHKKQTGGAGQFAEVHLRVEPLPRGAGFEYDWAVTGGAISTSFQSSIEKGIRQVLNQGAIAGYPVVDLRAVVYDGKEHPVDSKDIAFQIAGREVFKKVVKGAGPTLLEPIYKVSVTVPEEYTGDIIGDLNTRRAQVQGMDQRAGKTIINALAPFAEMQRYATDLRSLTQGRGLFSMTFDHYEPVPSHLQQEIVEAHRREQEE
ncbi:MAG: elongation factor G [Anaerolineae bacterium]|nr:elongation factor G [Anaerolineae bacterium]